MATYTNADEIKRKAAAGIPLANATAAAKAVYAAEKQRIEIERKAKAGIPLTNPTASAQSQYNAVKQVVTNVVAAAPAAIKQVVASVVNTAATSNPVKAVTAPNAVTTSAAAASSTSNRDKRIAEKTSFTGWDNDPAARELQEKWWEIYIDTGRKDTAEQKGYNEQAEMIRKYNNPMYDGSKNGPANWLDAEKITPRETTPNATGIEGVIDGVMNPQGASNMLTLGVGVVAIMFVFSMFRR